MDDLCVIVRKMSGQCLRTMGEFVESTHSPDDLYPCCGLLLRDSIYGSHIRRLSDEYKRNILVVLMLLRNIISTAFSPTPHALNISYSCIGMIFIPKLFVDEFD